MRRGDDGLVSFSATEVGNFLACQHLTSLELQVEAGLLTRPAQNGLLPTLSTTAEALTKANSVLATIENASILVAPAFAGVLLALVGPGAVYAFMSVALALAALVVSAVMWPADGAVAPVSAGLDAGQALKVLAADRRALLLVGLLAGQALQVGALDVLFVALALGVLGIGETGVGALNSALGLGGVIGAVVAGALAARSSLPRGLAIGVLVWGGGLAIVSALPNAGVVLAFVAAAGAGRGLMDVSGRTLLQRVAPLDVLSRVFGVLEGFSMAALAAGAAIAPILVETIGIGAAVLAVGAALPLTLVLTIRPLLRLETLSRTSPRELRILRAIPIFASLPVPTLERLAHTLERIDAPAGTVIVREGDMGDRLFVIDEGVLSVSIEERRIRQLGPGEFFGEIALLRDVPRTASVTALEPVRLYSLRREEFLSAMRSRPNGAHAAEAISWSREP